MKIFYILLLVLSFEFLEANIKADFRASKKVAFIEEEIYFENLSVGDSLNFKWDFGDFSSSFEKSPVHTYNIAGTFDIQLIAYNDNYSDTLIKEDYITTHEILEAKFDYDIKNATGGYSVNCINLSRGDIKSYEWNFYNGTVSSEQNPTAVYDEPGQYNISLKVKDNHFTDSIFVSDVVQIPYPKINLDNVNIEHIYYDLGSNSSLGNKPITNGYLTGTKGSRFFQIMKFNHNREISWKKQYRNSYYYSVKYDVDAFDNTWIALNSDLYHTNIEVIDYAGNQKFILSDPFDVSESGKYDIEDVAEVSLGIAVIANSGKEAFLHIYNNSGDLIFENSISDDDCLIDNYEIDFIKISEAYNNDIFIFMRKYSESENDYKYFYTHFQKQGDSYECMNISNGLCICNEIPDIPFEENAEFIIYDDDKLLYIQGRKVFNVTDFSSESPEFFNYSNLVHTEINGIDILEEDKFAVAGKFNGFMKLSIVDLYYDNVSDLLLNRSGYLKSVMDDGNGNLIVSGTIKKNYIEDALYYFSVPYGQYLSTKKYDEKNLFLYPNPADNYIYLDVDDEFYSEIIIYDITGNPVKYLSNINRKIDISDLQNGAYLIELNQQFYLFIKE